MASDERGAAYLDSQLKLPPHSIEAEHLQGARNQLAVEALTDKDDSAGVTEIDRTRKHALVPEAVDFGSGFFAKDNGDDAFFGEDFKAPGAADEGEKYPDDAGNDGQGQALAQGESGGGFGGH